MPKRATGAVGPSKWILKGTPTVFCSVSFHVSGDQFMEAVTARGRGLEVSRESAFGGVFEVVCARERGAVAGRKATKAIRPDKTTCEG